MARSADKVARFDADLVDSAIAEGERQQRTGRQQLEHWARVGRAMTAHTTAPLAKVRAALAGDIPPEQLSEAEGDVFNAEIRAAIAESLADADYRKTLAERGVTTVSMNDKGELVEYRPDGSEHILGDG